MKFEVEPVAPPPIKSPPVVPVASRDVPAVEPNFTLQWDHPEDQRRRLHAGIGSLVINCAIGLIFLFLASLPVPAPIVPAAKEETPETVTRLVLPPAALTQRAPNRKPVSKEFNLDSITPRESARNLPRPGAATPPPQAPPKFRPPAPSRAATPSMAVPDAPTLGSTELSTGPPPQLGVTSQLDLKPPPVPPETKPKLSFERPGADAGTGSRPGQSRLPSPKTSVEEAIRAASRNPSAQGMVVGDEDAANSQTPSPLNSQAPGKVGSSLELLSDPMGVDFWPYLMKVLASVRRNWYAVIPESARLGRGGRVVIQFAISKDGSVPKLVIAMPSGADALDRAAVAGISASNPFPPLPAEFRGGQIRLQFAFRYKVGPN